MSSSNNSQNQQPQQPGLWSSHAQYVKGATESAVGGITGSHAWKSSGEQDMAHAKADLQAASQHRDPATQGYGKWEETLGKVTGCDGMKQEGAASANKNA
ncbi:hypothetical protein GQ53DRAFT_689383 [Thozetella sp. PMI_491]|nr:hypothetical protein GQ53DRAFT_689383 [Thozetella sp. PMI_491]